MEYSITPILSPSRRLYEPWVLCRLYEPEAGTPVVINLLL
jgi:hypothetical protein